MIDNLKPNCVMTTDEESRCLFLIARLEELIAEVRAEHVEISQQHVEIRAEQQRLGKEIALELKHSKDDLQFFQNLNYRMAISRQQLCWLK